MIAPHENRILGGIGERPMDVTLPMAAALIGIGFMAGYAVRAWIFRAAEEGR